MAARTLRGRILRWGNSYALRITKREMERTRLRVGQDVKVTLQPDAGEVDYSDIAVISDPDPEASVKHDEYLGQAMEEESKRWRRKSA